MSRPSLLIAALAAGAFLVLAAAPVSHAEEAVPAVAAATATTETATDAGLEAVPDMVELSSLRERLARHGVTLELGGVWDGVRVAQGGVRRGSVALATMDAALQADLGALLGWTGWTARFHGLGQSGEGPSGLAGDAQAFDNIDFPRAWYPIEAWVEGVYGPLSVRGGVHDLNSDFDHSEIAALFLNSSHGAGADLTQSGANGPCMQPFTGLGGRIAWTPIRPLTVRVAMSDAIPGDPADPRHVDLAWRRGDGTLGNVEFDLRPGLDPQSQDCCDRYVLGAWHYTGTFADVRDVDGSGAFAAHTDNRGLYALVERRLSAERGHEGQGLAGWVRAGLADDQVNAFGRYTGAGLVYTGAFPGRDEDALGVAVAMVHAGSPFFDAMAAADSPVLRSETAFELTYQATITPWLSVQPDVQYITHPGLDPSLKNALAMGVRVGLSF